jgi:hypothetical protein
MITLYKFDLYSLYQAKNDSLTCLGGKNLDSSYSFMHVYYYREKQLLTPLPSHIEITKDDTGYFGKIKSNISFRSASELTSESKLYIHPDCTIPRAKVTQKYTKVLSPDKADFCVVPTIPNNINTVLTAVFVNREKMKAFFIKAAPSWERGRCKHKAPTKCENIALGTKVSDINPYLKGSSIEEVSAYSRPDIYTQENWKDFLESSLVFYGHAAELSSKEHFMADIMYGTYKNLITEDVILASLGDESNELNRETYDSIKEMLNSSDETVIGLGLKTLAELDYKKYYNTAIHLLCTSNRRWGNNKIRQNTSVKYMLKTLDLWRWINERYSKETTQEDFDMLKQVLYEDFKDYVEDFKRSFINKYPFANVEFSYDFNISAKLGEVKEVDITEDDD